MNKKTLVLGGSLKPERYANKAIRRLMQYHHPVVSLGLKSGQIGGVEIETGRPYFENIDTVTMYLNPANQKPYYDYLLTLKPKRVIFNPGTENPVLADTLIREGVEVVEHCTLVMLDMGIY